MFVHIPKTGGTSISSLLMANQNRYRVLEGLLVGRDDCNGMGKTLFSKDEDAQSLRDEIQRRVHQIDAVSGHIPYGVHALLDRPCRYFTLLREPMARARSMYAHASRRPDDSALGRALAACEGDLVRAISERSTLAFMNDQVRMITGTDKVELTEDDLELAKNMLLENYAVFGTLETMDASVRRLASHLGWERAEYCHLNAAPGATVVRNLSSREMTVLHEANQLDHKLYDWVQKTLASQ